MFDALLAARWCNFVALFVVVGGSTFRSLFGGAPSPAAAPAAIVAGLSGMAWVACIIAFAMGGFAVLGDPDQLRVVFTETPFAVPLAACTGLSAGLIAVAVAPVRARTRDWGRLAVGVPLLVVQGWLGHAGEGGDTALGAAMISIYAVHVLAAATWTGALPSLVSVLSHPRSEQGVDRVLARFSSLGMVAVVLVVATGVANAVLHAGDGVAAFLASGYGRILLVKVALVAAMLVIAAVNRFVLMPRLRRGFRAAPSRWLRNGVILETLLAAAVLGAVAILGVTPPPR